MHRFSYGGKFREDVRDGWCEDPARMVCVLCGAWHLQRCKRARASRCGYCAEVKRLDVASCGRSGWMDRPQDRLLLLTLTPPGQDVLPFDKALCRHSPTVKCSGKNHGCVVEARALAEWHSNIGQRWSWFVEDVRRTLRRRWPDADLQYLKAWEPQGRGALHAHAMTRLERCAVSQASMRRLVKLCALRYGFGPQADVAWVDGEDALEIARTAGYCSKYVTKSADALPDLLRVVPATGEVLHGSVRPWSATRRWGDTIAAVEARRRAWASTGGAGGAQATESLSTPGAAGDPGVGAAGALDLNPQRYAGATAPGVVAVGIAG